MPIQPHHHKPGLMIIGFLTLFLSARSQDYLIKHDFQKDKTDFFRVSLTDTVAVKQLDLRRPGRITLKVDNLNPFVFDAKVTAFKVEQEEQSSHIGVLLSGLIKASGASSFISLPTRGGASDKSEASEEWKKKLELLTRKATGFVELKEELQYLKYDVRKTESEIKSNARSAVTKLFGKDSLDLKEMRSLGRELDQEKKEIRDNLGQPNILPISFVDELTNITSLYHQVAYTPYRFLYTVNENADIRELKLQIFARTDTILLESPRDTISRYFSMEPKNSLRLRNSVGISFSHFNDNNKSYYIKPDTTIGSGSRDLFTPVLSTFINFYNPKAAGFKWGGSFGFGIPLLGDKKDIHFLLGFCTIIGRNEPIIISAGVTGGKVERLTEGWKVGQKAPSLSFRLPTASQFRAGGYMGITFNLSSLSPAKNGN